MNSQYVRTTKDLLLRTRGNTWNTIEPEDQGFARVHVIGSHRKYYVKVADLDKRHDRIQLYERQYAFPPLMYVAGPYSSPDEQGILANINNASKAALACARAGWAVHCPHKNFAGFHVHTDVPYKDWIDKDLAILAKSDAILLLDGWASSKGASQEFQFADERGIPQFFITDGIPKPDVIRSVYR